MSTTLAIPSAVPAEEPAVPAEHWADPKAIDAAMAARIEEFAYRYGRAFDSYLATDLARQYFWSSGRRGLVAFVRWGRHVVVIGGLLAPEEHWSELVRQFLEFGKRKRYTLTFFNIDPVVLPVFREHGLEITKVAEDALIDLSACTWKGKDFEWVRRQSNFCTRQGVVCRELHRGQFTDDAWQAEMRELGEVSREFLKSKPQGGQMRNFVSRFTPQKLRRQRVFVARADGGTGRAEAFIICNPARDGQMWSFEVFRQRHDAVRGSVAFLMHQAMQILQKEGVPLASLCIVPTLRCEKPLAGDSWLARKLLSFGHKYAGIFYDTQGMFHFKSRFRPQFEDRYAAVWPRASMMSIRAFAILWGVDRINPFRVFWRLIQLIRKRDTRATLANPDEE